MEKKTISRRKTRHFSSTGKMERKDDDTGVSTVSSNIIRSLGEHEQILRWETRLAESPGKQNRCKKKVGYMKNISSRLSG